MKHLIITILSITALISTTIDAKEASSSKKQHNVTLLGGIGPKGTEVKQTGAVVQVQQKRSFVFGAGYAQDVGMGLLVGGQILSNGTLLGTMGVSF